MKPMKFMKPGKPLEPLEHQAILERLSERLDGPLSAEDDLALEAHLAECADCRETQALLARTLKGLHGLPSVQAPDELVFRVQQELHTRNPLVPPRGVGARTLWPQELLSAAALALLVGASVTLGGRFLSPSDGGALGNSSQLSGLLGAEAVQAVELTFEVGDETAARAVLSSAADLGARSLAGAPLRPGEALPERGSYFFVRREALALIVPESIASLRESPPDSPGSAEAALPRPSPGWIRVHLLLR